MEARSLRLVLALCAIVGSVSSATAAEWKTANFIAFAPTEELAKKVAFTAEQFRSQLASEWLGYQLPNWSQPCPIRVKVGQIGAGGATTFNFDRGEVYGWRMEVQGTEERILDSVVPHEVSHTIFASHFRRPLPRWADEGAATLAEHESEQRRQLMTLHQVWNTEHRIPLTKLIGMKEYPTDMRDVMTLYAEGYSLANFLVQQGGKARYLKFLDDAERGSWEQAVTTHYRYESVSALEQKWGSWILAGSPELNRNGTVVASAEAPAGPGAIASPKQNATADIDDGRVIRAQSDDERAIVLPPTYTPTGPAAGTPNSVAGTPNAAPAQSGPAQTAQNTASPAANPAEFFADLAKAPAAPTKTVAAASPASSREARPAPLNSFVGYEQLAAQPTSATETTWQALGNGGTQPLPTNSPITSQPSREPDFYGSSAASNHRSSLGAGNFPGSKF